MGACTVPGEMAIVTELCERGNLETLLYNKKAQLTLYRRVVMAKETAVGMCWLHQSNPMIIHRDLKPSNLLVDKHGSIRVCDFGLSAIKPAHEKLKDKDTIPGTPLWMAPEVMMGRQVDEKADVYSYAIVLWELVSQKPPFPDMTSFPKFRQAVCTNNVRPPIDDPENPILPTICELLEKCWHKNPEARPSFEVIINMIDLILVDCAIRDPVGREFWKTHLKGRENVPFSEFLPLFLQFTKLSMPDVIQLECFKQILVTELRDNIMEPVEVVNIEQFGQLLDNFGPCSLEQKKKDKVSIITIFDRIYRICKQPWFHGDISKVKAEQMLRAYKEGYFLIRLSTTEAGCFTISRVTRQNTIHHQRINYKADSGYTTKLVVNKQTKIISAQNKSLRSFISLIKTDLHLVSACPGSKYRPIFQKTRVLAASGGYNEDFGDDGDETNIEDDIATVI